MNTDLQLEIEDTDTDQSKSLEMSEEDQYMNLQEEVYDDDENTENVDDIQDQNENIVNSEQSVISTDKKSVTVKSTDKQTKQSSDKLENTNYFDTNKQFEYKIRFLYDLRYDSYLNIIHVLHDKNFDPLIETIFNFHVSHTIVYGIFYISVIVIIFLGIRRRI
jgi:hypothetical protein